MARYVMALDQGTTSSRAILFDQHGRVAHVAQREYPQIFPAPGLVEHDPEAIWASQLGVAQEVVQKAGASPADVAAIGVTNQRETTIIWDKATGKPIYNAIVWQSRLTAPICDDLIRRGLAPTIRAKTGLEVDAYFSGTKIQWLLDNVPGARERAERGELLFGTVDTFLIWRLTGGAVHVTDYSNASRTMLFNINTLDWDDDLLRELRVPRALLPRVVPSSAVYGQTEASLFGAPIPIAGDAGDQQAATFGQACFTPGMAKNTFGTGCFLLLNTGEQPRLSTNRLLTTIGWGLGTPEQPQITYMLEGSVFVAGAAIQWLRDGLGIIEQQRGCRAARARGPRRGRRLRRASLRRPGRAVLGRPRARRDLRADARLDGGACRPRHPRRDGLPDARAAGGDAGRRGRAAADVAGGWRRVRQRPADAVPGGYSQRHGPAASGARDDGAGRGLSRRAGGGLLARPGGTRRSLGARPRVSPAMPAEQRDRLYAGWKKAISRAREWEDA